MFGALAPGSGGHGGGGMTLDTVVAAPLHVSYPRTHTTELCIIANYSETKLRKNQCFGSA